MRRLHQSFATLPWWTGAAWIATAALIIFCRSTGVMVPRPGHLMAWKFGAVIPWFLLAGGAYSLACKIARGRRRYSSIGVFTQFLERQRERRKSTWT
jgi:hypothetical protein